MAQQGWARFLVLFITILILVTPHLLFKDKRSSTWVKAVPADTLSPDSTFFGHGLDISQHDSNNGVYDGGHEYHQYKRRGIIQDVIEDKDDTAANPPSVISRQSINNAQLHRAKVASTVCNPNIPQMLGPGWNGSFASNSPDGYYPSQTRSCTWIIQAISNISGLENTPYVIAVKFWTPIQLVCGIDYLTLYDGPDTSSPILAKLCGNTWFDKAPIIYSTGPHLTAVFSSQARTPGSFGFTAGWTSVAPCSLCVGSGRGTCSSTKTCNCSSRYSGAVCESETAGFKDFTPRSQHAMAYDHDKEMVYIMGGTSLRNPFIWDLLTYTFATNKWNKITINTKNPDPRYGHFAFMYNNDLYVYGGVSVVGGLADVWKFNGKAWTHQQPINPEKLPSGRIGSACVLVSNNNSTRLYVFGGLDSAGRTTRELNVYDINLDMWKASDHKNSVGLSGATAVYHQATDSIYYFGGMVNPTTRNVITYQYRISQDLWYALAPRIDPLTADPIPYWNGTQPDSPSTVDTKDEDTEDDPYEEDAQTTETPYLPPVMYDPWTTVWSPAGSMGDDFVVMYGGMRPYGPGVHDRDQSCYAKNVSIYDLSCQTWTSFYTAELDEIFRGRANHTMIMRPPGSSGGNKTAWTAYIFGGFDGQDHADMLSITMSIPAPAPASVNNCREDVPKSGTVQDLIRQRPEFKSRVLAPDACPSRIALDLDNPHSGTIQIGEEMTFKIYVDANDLDVQFEIRTLPTSALDFKSLNVWEGFMNMYWRADHGLTDDSWDGYSGTSSPVPSDIMFDDHNLRDRPVITRAGILNTSELMNRWTKYSGLDSSRTFSAYRQNSSYIRFPASDARRFSGYYVFSLTNRNDISLSFSVTATLLDRPTTVDKATGSSFNMATLGLFMLGFILSVVLLVFLARKIRQLIDDRDASHRAAEMQLLEDEEEERNRNGRGHNGGMTMAQADEDVLVKKPMYRIVVGIQDLGRDVVDISGPNLRHRIVRGTKSTAVNDSGNVINSSDNNNSDKNNSNSNTIIKHSEKLRTDNYKDTTVARSFSESFKVQAGEEQSQPGSKPRRSRVKSDYIRDIGSAPLLLPASEDVLMMADGSNLADSSLQMQSVPTPDLEYSPESEPLENSNAKDSAVERSSRIKDALMPNRQVSRRQQKETADKDMEDIVRQPHTRDLQRGWSLKGLGTATSLRRLQSTSSKISPEEREGLTSPGFVEDEEKSADGDSDQEVIDLSILSTHTDLLQIRQEQLEKHQRECEEVNAATALLRQRRNPIKVQPISVEPLPFHSGLVPRTWAHLRRYQRTLARQQQQLQRQQSNETICRSPLGHNGSMNSARSMRPSRNQSATPSSPVSSSSSSISRRVPARQIRETRSQGSLRAVHKVASRMTLRTNGESVIRTPEVARPKSMAENRSWFRGRAKPESDLETGIELVNRQTMEPQEAPHVTGEQGQQQTFATQKRKQIKMRGRQEYEPGPLLAMNVLIVFPGDSGARGVRQLGDSGRSTDERGDEVLYDTEKRLPPMAIGTVFVPDPVRWWAYIAKQQLDRRRFERQLRKRMLKQKERSLQRPQPVKTR
ncbi:Multiple epidermal growth factor-like domains protein 8 [Mortierella polycephala]|uniref:Multiple epidermal growth factor-like domains protein 8 n=1 Tax=Mortierella polycephala TaxID=41804 RepID=A0A9P6QF86_9FUNG|nr:Multiple epidermal growth factor-like domains protein 8 [Mortierella polycephala]